VPAVVCAFLGTLALVFGWLRVTALTTDFNLPTQTGIGLIVAAAGLALAGVVLLADLAGQNKTGPQPAPRPVSSGAPQKMD
jgi:FtsH-binding integral membrane protein